MTTQKYVEEFEQKLKDLFMESSEYLSNNQDITVAVNAMVCIADGEEYGLMEMDYGNASLTTRVVMASGMAEQARRMDIRVKNEATESLVDMGMDADAVNLANEAMEGVVKDIVKEKDG